MYFSIGVAYDPIKGCTDALVSLVDQGKLRFCFSVIGLVFRKKLAPRLSMSPHDVETYSNKEVIAVDQDALGIQGQIVWENCPWLVVCDTFFQNYVPANFFGMAA